MIDYIKGTSAELTPATAIIECNGIGYELNISLTTYTAIQGKKDEVKLYVQEQIREDAWTLYGFSTRGEREMFRTLTAVSGVGAATARMILSALSPRELVEAIEQGKTSVLKAIKGVGPRTAARLLVELKDRLPELDGLPLGTEAQGRTAKRSVAAEEAIAALTMLGFPSSNATRVVSDLEKQQPDAPTEVLVKMALKALR